MYAYNESSPQRIRYLLVSLLAICLTIAAHAQTKTSPSDDKPATDRYGDPLPPGAIVRLGTVRFRHGGQLRQIHFSSDGRTLFSVSSEYQRISIQAWDASTGRRRWQVALRGTFGGIGVSADGKMLAVSRHGQGLQFLDAATGKEIQPLGEARIANVNPTFSPDGQLLAVVNTTAPLAVHIWDLQGRKIRQQIETKAFPASPSFSSDGKRLAFIDGSTVRVCNVTDGKEIHRLETGSKERLRHLTFCCGGKLLAAASGEYDPRKREHAIRLWDAATGKEAGELKGHENSILALSAAPTSNLLASAGFDETIRFWDTATQQEVGRYSGQSGIALSFSHDGKVLASADQISALRLWHAPKGGEIRIPADQPNFFWWAAFSPDGQTLITAGEGQFGLWEPLTGRARRIFADKPHDFYRTALSPDGKILATTRLFGTNEVLLWDVATGQRLRRLVSDSARSLQPIAFSPDGRTLAASDTTLDLIRVFDVADGKESRQLKGQKLPNAFAFSPDGAKVVCAGLEGRTLSSTIRLFELAGGKEIWRKEKLPWVVNDLAFSPNGRTLTLAGGVPGRQGQSGEVRLWDTDSGEELRRFEGHRGQVYRLAFSPDGRTLATGSHDKTIRLWEVIGGGERKCLTGHRYAALSISFAPDGRLLATAGGDFTVLIWDLTSRFRDGRFQPHRLSAEERLRCWDDLAGSDAAVAYRSIHALAAADETVTFLQERLRPVTAAEPKRTASLLAALESDQFAERKRASDELEKLSFAAEPALRQALKGKPSLESRRRIEQILVKLDYTHGLRVRRAVEVLELIATPEARRVLTVLAGGDAAALPTREAKAALTRHSDPSRKR